MNTRRRQRGMTFWMILFILIVFGTLFFLMLKLLPVYLESHKIDRAIESVAKEPGAAEKSRAELADMLVKRFDIDDVHRISERNFREHVEIITKGNRVTIIVDYRAEVPLAGNVSLVADFEKRASN